MKELQELITRVDELVCEHVNGSEGGPEGDEAVAIMAWWAKVQWIKVTMHDVIAFRTKLQGGHANPTPNPSKRPWWP